MKNGRRRNAPDAAEPLRARLRQAVAAAGHEGVDYYALADIMEGEFPDEVALLSHAHLVAWIRTECRGMRTRSGAPLVGSFRGKAVQIKFWDVEMFRVAIEHYVSPARKNLALARALADECRRLHGVRIAVPSLDERATASAV